MRRFKFLSVGLALALVFNMLPMQSLMAAPSDNSTAAASTEDEIVVENIDINSVEDFLEFANNCYIDSWSLNKYVTLKSDINLSDVDFDMVPVFSGTFDGFGHTISGFNSVGDGYVAGLFRYIQKNGIVKNLKLKGNITGTDEKECIGSICGINYGTVKNCSFQGTISGNDTIGGIVGTNETTGIVTGCSSDARISGYYTTGGIVGRNHGTVTYCTSRSGINNDSEWVEEDDEMGTGLFFSLNISDDSADLYSGVDTGGIVGYSDGFVSRCTNYGKVGYEHTGYNIGGIAGRQKGIISLCTNYGEVYGRKDIGGIVGQMEPDIEVDSAESLRNAINKLHDLIDKTLSDLRAGTNVISSDFDNLNTYGDGVLESGDILVGQMLDFVDENIGQTQAVTGRIEHVFDMLPEVMDDVSYAGDAFNRLNDIFDRLIDDLNISDKIDDGAYDETEYNRLTLLSTVGGRISSSSTNPDVNDEVTITVKPDEGYKLVNNSITAADANGNGLKLTKINDTEYTFTMSEANAKVTAYFEYDEDSIGKTSYNTRVSAGFNALVDDIYIIDDEPTPRAEDISEAGSSGEAGDKTNTETDENNENNKETSDDNKKPDETTTDVNNNPDSNQDILPGDEPTADDEDKQENEAEETDPEAGSGTPHKIKSKVQNGSGNSSLEIVVVKKIESSDDVDNTKASEGDRVIIYPKADTDCMLKSLSVIYNGSSEIPLTKSNNGKSYYFTMPNSDVEITAVFEQMQIILSSNLSGNATYSAISDGTVTLKITPDSGYTVSSTPTVTDKDGKSLSVTKKQNGSYIYEFNINETERPIRASITFTKQNKSNAVNASTDDIEASIKDLREASNNVNASLDKIKKLRDDNKSPTSDEVINEVLNLLDYLGDMSDAASSILSDLSTIYNVLSPYVDDASEAAKEDINHATDELHIMIDYLKSATRGLRNIVNYINAQSDIQFSMLGDEFDENRNVLYGQLQGISDILKVLNNDSIKYSDRINADLKAVNNQLNVVFNLFADHLTDYSALSLEELYEEISDEDIEFITTGRTDGCTNKGIVKGDINIGGIAGSMSIDDEDPEDNAAGDVEYEIGQRYITKCIIADSVNEGYVTAKKDGAGGIVGYMRHGIVVDSEGYGSVESTEGNYAGGICGKSLTIIKRCYAICSVSGGKNVGGIAGYADTLQACYAIVNAEASVGRKGAIAGQITSYENTQSGDNEEAKVSGNYYVSDELFGIDNISYIGVAEPISYADLLTVENLPNEFWHLKVVYRIEDTYLGSQEVKYGESLANLTYPQIPEREGFYGVWPDYSDRVMVGNLVIEGEYRDNVTVVESNEKFTSNESDSYQKPYAFVEQIFTQDTQLRVNISNMSPPADALDKEYVIYDIALENGGIGDNDTFAVRILNPYGDNVEVWGYLNGSWTQIESKVRGQYLQVDMTGDKEAFCIIETKTNIFTIIIAVAAVVIVFVILSILTKQIKKHNNKRKSKNQQKK